MFLKSTYLREERDKALYKAYSNAVKSGQFANVSDALDYARTHEAPRFYIDPAFVRRSIFDIKDGKAIRVTGNNTAQKFYDLYEMYKKLSVLPDYRSMTALEICELLVCMPAPQFYISTRTARMIIKQQKVKKWESIVKRFVR